MAHNRSSERSRGVTRDRRWGRHVSRRYEIRPGGLLYFAITLFIAIGAINSQNNLLFWLFGMAVGAIIVSGIASGAALMGLHARRIAPSFIESGSQGIISYELRHRGRLIPAFALLICETSVPAEQQGRVGLLEPAWASIGHLSPGSVARGQARVLAGRRGLVMLNRFEVSSTFPFGLFRKTLVFEHEQRIAVTPARLPVREGLLESVATDAERGVPQARRSGVSDEYFGLRAYVEGDSPRLIAWKRSAALGELVVRQHASPTPPRMVLELDAGLARADEFTKELALALLSTLAMDACALGYTVGLDIAWAGYRSPLGGGARLVRQRLAELAAIELEPQALELQTPGISRAAGRTIIHAPSRASELPAGASGIDVSSPTRWLKPGVSMPPVSGESAQREGLSRRSKRRDRRAASGSEVAA